MTFLPIVERELRVRARLKGTYRFRLWAAAGAIIIVGLLLMAAETIGAAGRYGGMVFAMLAWLSFCYCLLDGARNTADCLSEEKRSGTLGLLFLTDLRPYDVVLGKLIATSVNSFYGLLAIFPPLAISLVIGGVTIGEFWRMVLALLNALLFSLTAGLAVSSAARDERHAWTATMGLVLGFAVLLPMLLFNPSWSSSVLAAASPTTAFIGAFDNAYATGPDRYWKSIWCVQLLSWGFLSTAMFVLPRAWQDRPPASNNSWWARWLKPAQHKDVCGDFASRSLLLDSNPIVWLVARGRGRNVSLWMMMGVSGVVAMACWTMIFGVAASTMTILTLMVLVHLSMAVCVAIEACHLFGGARDSGALELLLCTPLTAQDVIEGHMLGLKKMFFRPVALLLSIELLLLSAQTAILLASGGSVLSSSMLPVGVVFCLAAGVMDLFAVARYGLWQGLVNPKPTRAVTRTVLYVLVLPLVPAVICIGCMLPVLLPVKSLIFINYARNQMNRRFRSIVTERHGWAEGTEFVGQPARARPLPPVLPR